MGEPMTSQISLYPFMCTSLLPRGRANQDSRTSEYHRETQMSAQRHKWWVELPIYSCSPLFLAIYVQTLVSHYIAYHLSSKLLLTFSTNLMKTWVLKINAHQVDWEYLRSDYPAFPIIYLVLKFYITLFSSSPIPCIMMSFIL